MNNNKTTPEGYASMAAAVLVADFAIACAIWLAFNMTVGHYAITYWQAVGATLLLNMAAILKVAFSQEKR